MLRRCARWSPDRALDQPFQPTAFLVNLRKHGAFERSVGSINLNGARHPRR